MDQIFSNTNLTVNQLIEKNGTGESELQRSFIWKDSKVRDLFDSMMRGYPIDYLMLNSTILTIVLIKQTIITTLINAILITLITKDIRMENKVSKIMVQKYT